MNKLMFDVVFPTVFLSMSGFCLVLALKTLITRRPVVLAAKWLFAVMCLCFLPLLFSSATTAFSEGDFDYVILISPLMFTVLLIFMWIQMRGYLFFAISDEYFREALLSSAQSLGFTIEETMSQLKIQETGQEMQVAVQGWIGTAQLKSKGKDAVEVVNGLACRMRDYFRTTPGRMNYLTSYLYLAIGIFMIAFAAWLIFDRFAAPDPELDLVSLWLT